MEEFGSVKEREEGLAPYLSPLGAWSLSVGTAIGWGSFVFTTNLYLSEAGPLGSVLGLLVGMAIMLLISRNYHYLINYYPAAGGVYAYVKKIFGYDRAFLSFWYVGLAYLAMLWANATSVPLFARNFFGDIFCFGYLYTIFNYKIYLGEVLLTMAVILLTGLLCMKRERHAVRLMKILALTFTAGIVFCFITAMLNRDAAAYPFQPAYIPDMDVFSQVTGIALIAPWAFIGFENLSHSAREFNFSHRHTFKVMVASVVTVTLLYIFVILLSISAFPPDFENWLDYIRFLKDNGGGVKALPVFYAASHYLGDTGVYVLAVSLFALVLTSLIGNTVALSRLFYHVAKDEVLPDRFAELNKRRNPERAVELIMILSIGIPLLGRTAVGWIVDVLTITAILVYGMVSAAAYKLAKEQGKGLERFTGLAGMAIMGAFALLQLFPELNNYDQLETETYFLITIWSVAGFVFLRNVLHRDYARNFGRSVVAWVALMGLITFMSLSWMRQSDQEYADKTMAELRSFYRGEAPAAAYAAGETAYIRAVKQGFVVNGVRNNSFVLVLIMFSLGMFFTNYIIVQKRAAETEIELGITKALAYKDAMTGVKSKQAYVDTVNLLNLKIQEGAVKKFAMLVCDVNGLKHINDTFGHKAGDEYICAASDLICQHFKNSPVFRTGGDEFVAILEDRGYVERKACVEAFNRQVEANVKEEGKVVVSVGLSEYIPGQDQNVHDVFERADALMYKRKMQLKGMGAKTRD
ncbi:MAG: amino acid permease [Acidaminococcaceae bacterium]|nr:amino acid permease [Acidaminococcaceae bacterium]